MTFNVFTQEKRLEKLNYTHWNPVKRGLVENRKNGSGPALTTMRLESKEE